MIRVDQSIVDKGEGDCMRACLASMLELPLDAVPHLMRFGEGVWFKVMFNFLWALDYDFFGTGRPQREGHPEQIALKDSDSIKGFVMAAVPSRTFTDVGHSVVVNLKGLIVHDPNPNKKWQNVNVVESGELLHWSMIGPKEEETS